MGNRWSYKYCFVERCFQDLWNIEGLRTKNPLINTQFVDFSKAFDSIHRGKMEQIILANGFPKETVAAITMLYKKTKVKVHLPDGDRLLCHCFSCHSRGTFASYLFLICLYYILRNSIDLMKEKGFTLEKARRYPALTITDTNYADDTALQANAPT